MIPRLPLTLLTALLGACPILAAKADAKPNILHIVADDLGWQDVGFNGCKDIRTPHLDGLASQGAKLSQFYVLPMCTPTRACLLTGRYPFRYGLQTAVIPSVSAYGLDTSEVLMPQILKEAGYDTAIIGKWHLGHADRKFWPRQRGFDYQYGAMIGELDYFTHSEHGVLDWYRDNEPVKEEGYTTNLLGDDAVRYIGSRDGKKPFYLYLTFNAPHTPYQAPDDIIAKYSAIADPTRRTYAAMVDCLDANIGKVIAALEAKGLRENTIIIFHSDNGGTKNAMFAGVMADMSKITIPCDNGPYRDGKGSLFEGACRVAACVNWPGKIKAGTVDGIIHAADILPTLSQLAGASTKNCKPLDGVDVWQVLANGAASPRTEVVYNVEPFRAAIRQGSHKLIWRSTLPSTVDLYDLDKDPSETRNIAQDNPRLVESMKLRLNALAAEAAQPLFLADQFKVIMRNMNGKPLLPWEPGYSDAEAMPDAGKPAH